MVAGFFIEIRADLSSLNTDFGPYHSNPGKGFFTSFDFFP